jgi:hypothetical protein
LLDGNRNSAKLGDELDEKDPTSSVRVTFEGRSPTEGGRRSEWLFGQHWTRRGRK